MRRANLAQGSEAVHIVADAARFGGRHPDLLRRLDRSHRATTPARLSARSYRARFLNGGAFSGGTDLVVWAEPSLAPGGRDLRGA